MLTTAASFSLFRYAATIPNAMKYGSCIGRLYTVCEFYSNRKTLPTLSLVSNIPSLVGNTIKFAVLGAVYPVTLPLYGLKYYRLPDIDSNNISLNSDYDQDEMTVFNKLQRILNEEAVLNEKEVTMEEKPMEYEVCSIEPVDVRNIYLRYI